MARRLRLNMAHPRDKFSTRIRVAAAVAMTAVVATGVVTGSGVAFAAPSTPQSPAAAAEQRSEHAAELLELRTPDNAATFYTLSKDEAEKAQSAHGFKSPTGETAGITMFTRPVPGTIAVHRLKRENVDHHSYILSSYEDEIEALTSERQRGLKFKDQGIVGYVYAEQREGTMPLYRYAKSPEWRVARNNRVDLLAAGFEKSKNPIGFVPKG
jgi:hypothetical protein